MAYLSFTGKLNNFNIFLFKTLHAKPDGLEFSFEKCECDGGPLFDAYVKNKEWKKTDIFYCKIVIPSNCGDYYWYGDYSINKEQITLYYG